MRKLFGTLCILWYAAAVAPAAALETLTVDLDQIPADSEITRSIKAKTSYEFVIENPPEPKCAVSVEIENLPISKLTLPGGTHTTRTEALHPSITLDNDNRGWSVKKGQKIVVTIVCDDEKWTINYSTGPEGEWDTTYGFTFVPNEDEVFFSKADDTDGTFVITEENDNEELDFAPSILFQYRQPGTSHGWLAGLGHDLDNVMVFGGYGLTYRENITFAAGVVIHEQDRLDGRFSPGALVQEQLDSDQLLESTFEANVFFGISFRFDRDPHAERAKLEKKLAEQQRKAADDAKKAKSLEKEKEQRIEKCKKKAEVAYLEAKGKCEQKPSGSTAEKEAKERCTELAKAKRELARLECEVDDPADSTENAAQLLGAPGAGETPGISGMAQLSRDSYLVVHDAKNKSGSDEEPRLGILDVTDDGINYSSLATTGWKNPEEREGNGGVSSDLESACALAGRPNEILAAESGDWMKTDHFGRLFHLAVSRPRAEIVQAYDLPSTQPSSLEVTGDQYEGLACILREDGRYLVLVGERGGSEAHPKAFLRWGHLDPREESLEWTEDKIDVKAPTASWPEGVDVRGISDLYADPDGVLWAVAAGDHYEESGASPFDETLKDNGPFRSVIYRLGTIEPGSETPIDSDKHHPKVFWTLDGFKIEALAAPSPLVRGSVLAVASDDENFDGVWRALYPSAPADEND